VTMLPSSAGIGGWVGGWGRGCAAGGIAPGMDVWAHHVVVGQHGWGTLGGAACLKHWWLLFGRSDCSIFLGC